MSDLLTHAQMILAAARTLSQPFTPADLVVAAWERYPEAFGLPGYREKFPHAAAVYSKLYGANGVIASGAIVKLAFDSLRVNEAWKEPKRTTDRREAYAAALHMDASERDTLALIDRVQGLELENAQLRRANARLRAERESGWMTAAAAAKETGT